MIAIVAQIHEAAWGSAHGLAWGWWLLIVTPAALLVGLVLYRAILLPTTWSGARRPRTRDGRAEDAHPKKVAQHPRHAPATT